MKDSELKALIALLGDEDDEIVNQAEGRLMNFGTGALPVLEQGWEENPNPLMRQRVGRIVHVLRLQLLRERLEDWKANRQDDLLEGLWLVATYQFPDLDIEGIRREIHQYYVEAREEIQPGLLPYDLAKAINHVVFKRLKFCPNTEHFHAPENNMINAVLDSKKGNPVSLCAVYLLIAQKMGVPVYGVNLPNLFVLAYRDDSEDFYISAFNKGLIFTKSDMDNYLENLGVPPQDIFYRPCENLDIVLRLLRNLIVAFEKLGEYRKNDEIKVILRRLDDQYSSFG